MTLIIAAILLVPALVTAFFVVEVLAGLPRAIEVAPAENRTRATVIVPAHDEELVLGPTLEMLSSALPAGGEILVVADNCTDRTAQVARRMGVRVVERQDSERRGKGFALAFARDTLAADPPEVVVIVDADCTIDAVSLGTLVGVAASSGDPCQSINLLRPAPGASPMVQISTFAFMLKNLVRQRGLQRLANRVHLTGTGMALPWRFFAAADLATASIVEDIRLGFELAEAGAPPRLVHGATIWSHPSGAGGTLVQRRRWEGGYLAMARQVAPRALARALTRFNLRGVAAALDLCVPPLALLGLANGVLLTVAALATVLLEAAWWPVLILAALSFAMGAAVLLAWAREGRAFLTAATLLRLPFYILWKVPLYLGLTRKGAPEEWLRTGR